MTIESIYLPLKNHFELKLEIFSLKVEMITISRRENTKKTSIKKIEKKLKITEEAIKNVEQLISDFIEDAPFSSNTRFNIMRLKQIEGMSHTEVAKELDCSLSYVKKIVLEYKAFYYARTGNKYIYL